MTKYIDIMQDGRHICQLPMNIPQRREVIDGESIEFFDPSDLKFYVELMKPSLRGKEYSIEFSNKRV